MFHAHRTVAAALAAGGLLAGVPAVAQEPPPMIGLGDALRAGVVTVPARTADRLRIARATGLLGTALRARGYRPLAIAACHHSRPRVVLCSVDLALEQSRWQGTGSVRLLERGGARVRYSVTGVDAPAG